MDIWLTGFVCSIVALVVLFVLYSLGKNKKNDTKETQNDGIIWDNKVFDGLTFEYHQGHPFRDDEESNRLYPYVDLSKVDLDLEDGQEFDNHEALWAFNHGYIGYLCDMTQKRTDRARHLEKVLENVITEEKVRSLMQTKIESVDGGRQFLVIDETEDDKREIPLSLIEEIYFDGGWYYDVGTSTRMPDTLYVKDKKLIGSNYDLCFQNKRRRSGELNKLNIRTISGKVYTLEQNAKRSFPFLKIVREIIEKEWKALP